MHRVLFRLIGWVDTRIHIQKRGNNEIVVFFMIPHLEMRGEIDGMVNHFKKI